MSIWSHYEYRYLWVDQTFSICYILISAMGHFGQGSLDTGLFIRPFNTHSWMTTAILAAILILASASHRKFIRWMHSDGKEQVSGRIITLSSWLFFLLINAFYAAALTSFFASKSSLPFETVSEAISSWPRWKAIAVQEELLYMPSISPPGYIDKMRKEGLIFDAHKEALAKLKEPGYFYVGGHEAAITEYLKLDPPQPHLHVLQPTTRK